MTIVSAKQVADSLTVSFGSGAGASGALITLELDGAMNVDSDGNEVSSFAPGDHIFFRLHHDSSVRLARMAATHGDIDAQGQGQRPMSDEILWTEQDNDQALSYIPAGDISGIWYGRVAIGLKKSGTRDIIISGGDFPALATISYFADFSLYRLVAPDVELAADDTWPVRIVAFMEEV